MEEGELKIDFIVLRTQRKIHENASAFCQGDTCSCPVGFKAVNRKLCYAFFFLL